MRGFVRVCVLGTAVIGVVWLLAGRALCQPAPAGQDEKKEKPHEVPQSPEEKKALEDGKQEERPYDEVVLNDGTKIRGKVVDPGGPTITVEQKLGSVSILKRHIEKLRLRSRPGLGEHEDDVVHLKSGKTIRGNAQISPDGKKLTVTITKGEQKHSVTFPYEDVARIEWAKERKERFKKFKDLEDPLSAMIEKRLKELASKEEALWKKARDKLVGLGVFATDYLKDKLPKLEEPAASRVKEVLRINEIKSYVSPEVVEALKEDIYGKLTSPKKEEKLSMLRKLVLLEEDGAVALLAYLARQKDENREVRNFCLHNLAEKDQNEHLLRLMVNAQKDDGWLRLAAALYMADNGIYAGVPHFISALRMRDPGVRKLTAEKLRQASGENFGFNPKGTEEERETAIAKWEKWWKQHSAEILRQSAKVLGSRVADDDRSFSLVYQKRAHTSWDKEELDAAADGFRKALELDPSNLAARLSLAVLLYTEVGKTREARKELKLILKRYSEEASPTLRKLAFYHLALLDLTGGRWESSIHNLQAAILLDRSFADGYIALGKTYYTQAVSDEAISRESLLKLSEAEREVRKQRRNRVIELSVRALECGLALLDRNIREVTSMDFRKRRREAERELQERLGAKAEGLTQTEWEASFKKTLLVKKARVYSMLADSHALGLEWRKAARCLRNAARLVPESAKYLCKLGTALAASGRRKEAREAFERVVKIDPENETAIQGLKDLK